MEMNPRQQTIALITGAGSPTGIGFAVAKALGHAGHRIAITSMTARIEDRALELRAHGIDAVGFAADLTDAKSVSVLIDQVGDVEVLVNNAGMASLGVLDPTGPLEDMTTAAWAGTIERNLTTAFYVTRACLRGMKARRSGRIVNVASTTGPVNGIAFAASYAAAKAGMLGLTRSLCLEVARHGITVNSVAPGVILTSNEDPRAQDLIAATPAQRSGTPEEIADAVLYFISASNFVTGQVLAVDGGLSQR